MHTGQELSEGDGLASAVSATPAGFFPLPSQGPTGSGGRVYMGFRNSHGEREGYGVMQGQDGAVYTGQWAASHRNGHGTLFFDGGVFEGQWSAGNAHGKGRVHFKNGDVFEGSYANNKKCGHGVYRWSDGAEEAGEYIDGQKRGWHQWWHGDSRWHLLYKNGAVVAAKKAGAAALG